MAEKIVTYEGVPLTELDKETLIEALHVALLQVSRLEKDKMALYALLGE